MSLGLTYCWRRVYSHVNVQRQRCCACRPGHAHTAVLCCGIIDACTPGSCSPSLTLPSCVEECGCLMLLVRLLLCMHVCHMCAASCMQTSTAWCASTGSS